MKIKPTQGVLVSQVSHLPQSPDNQGCDAGQGGVPVESPCPLAILDAEIKRFKELAITPLPIIPKPMEFQPGVFYPFPYLEIMLAGVMSLQTFLANLSLDRTGKNRIFQNGLWGNEILKAIDSTSTHAKRPETGRIEVPATNRRARSNGFVPVGRHEVLTGVQHSHEE